MTTRKHVLKALEDAKGQGIENSLDAGVELPNSLAISAMSDDLADIFGVSRVHFSSVNDIIINNLQHNSAANDHGNVIKPFQTC